MRRMGFHEKWVGWVLKCITIVTYSVLINGEAHGRISPTRGLRQGDPLSSYLFLLCMEAFSALISDATIEIFSMEYPYAGAALKSLTYSSQMIVCFFVRQIRRRSASWLKFWGVLKPLRDKKSTWISLK